MTTTRQRLTTIAALYVSQAIPLGFFVVAMPAILRSQGLSLESVGLLGALALPWLVKFLWAPIVDRFGSRRFGHYRSWIIPLQTVAVLAVVAVSAIDLAQHFAVLVVAGAVFMLCSATQDIATDGMAVRSLRYDERGHANGIQVGGYYLGQVLGGGLILVVYSRFGWTTAVLTMAAFLALPMLPVMRFREPEAARPLESARVDFGALRRFVERPGAGVWIAILLLYRTGESMALTMVNPMLVDLGMSLEQIGLLLGLGASLAALTGAIAGGAWVARIGRKTSLALFGLLQTAALCGYLLPASGFAQPAAVFSVVIAAAFAGGMATAALYTNMMDRCDPRTAATDFTLQQSLCAVGPLLGATLSGFSAAYLGYALHFLLCAAIALSGVIVVARWLTGYSAAPEEVRP